jgi:cardiolipin synthase C
MRVRLHKHGHIVNQTIHGALLALLMGGLAGCALPRGDSAARPSPALTGPAETPLGGQVALLAASHPGLTGCHLLEANLDAFRARVELADAARSTLDVQSYIIWGDHTGRMLAERLLQAADRGVRVRILVDDVQMVWRDSWITRLDAHPNIDLRVFNPFRGTRTFPALALWDLFESGRLTRRMHNKLFVADNAVAIMGGRNIGDEYFAARADRNFEDLDVLVMGPAVQELSKSFNEFWTNEWAYPVGDWESDRRRAKDIQKARQTVESRRSADAESYFGEALSQPGVLSRLLDGGLQPDWVPARVVYDQPMKINGGTGENSGIKVVPRVWSLVEGVTNEVIVISPYFVPGDEGVELFRKLRQRGVRVRILTNSLGSTDAAAAQAGYARYRKTLLRMGIELYELRPSAMSRPLDRRWFRRHATRPQSSLHAKAFVLDRTTVLVGSMNLDQRAHYLNTELGLIIDSPKVAEKVAAMFEESTQPPHSYRMAMEPFYRVTSPKLAAEPVREWPVWITGENGREVHHTYEPHANFFRKLMMGLLEVLPIEGQL